MKNLIRTAVSSVCYLRFLVLFVVLLLLFIIVVCLFVCLFEENLECSNLLPEDCFQEKKMTGLSFARV